MKIINRQILEEFKNKHAEIKKQVDAWLAEAETANWCTPQEIKNRYASASFLADNQVVFNFKEQYRLAVRVDYKIKIIFIKQAGKHDEYMKWKLV